jgi:hypothetical protein
LALGHLGGDLRRHQAFLAPPPTGRVIGCGRFAFANGIVSVGRNAEFEYINMDEAVRRRFGRGRSSIERARRSFDVVAALPGSLA